jgi:hypothetical protein
MYHTRKITARMRKQAEEQFAVISCKLHPEGHSVILGKMQDSPVPCHVDLLT